MQYREAAVRVSQTLMMIARELSTSMHYLSDYVKEGHVSKEEFDEYFEKTQRNLDKLYTEVLEPIYQCHPDLQPKCCGCGDDTETENNE